MYAVCIDAVYEQKTMHDKIQAAEEARLEKQRQLEEKKRAREERARKAREKAKRLKETGEDLDYEIEKDENCDADGKCIN